MIAKRLRTKNKIFAMSHRGGFGGSGRGGFKGFQTAGGIDVPEGLVLNYSEIPLYPDVALNPCPSLSLLDQERVALGLEFLEEMYKSPFYLDTQKQDLVGMISLSLRLDQLERYSDRYKPKLIRKPLRSIHTHLSFFPSELHNVKDPKATKRTGTRLFLDYLHILAVKRSQETTLDLKSLEQLEKEESKGEDKNEEEEEIPQEYDEEMDEEEGDYQLDYYEEDMDMIGGDSDGNNDDY